jgi:hypothetical protein
MWETEICLQTACTVRTPHSRIQNGILTSISQSSAMSHSPTATRLCAWVHASYAALAGLKNAREAEIPCNITVTHRTPPPPPQYTMATHVYIRVIGATATARIVALPLGVSERASACDH